MPSGYILKGEVQKDRYLLYKKKSLKTTIGYHTEDSFNFKQNEHGTCGFFLTGHLHDRDSTYTEPEINSMGLKPEEQGILIGTGIAYKRVEGQLLWLPHIQHERPLARSYLYAELNVT